MGLCWLPQSERHIEPEGAKGNNMTVKYIRLFFAIDNNLKTVYASLQKAKIDELLLNNSSITRLSPKDAREVLCAEDFRLISFFPSIGKWQTGDKKDVLFRH